MAQSPLPSLRDGLRILFRQKYRVGLTMVVVLALTALAVVFLPRRFASEAKMYIRIGRENLAIDPIATPGETLSVTADRDGEIESLMQIVSSRGVMEAVVASMGADAIIDEELPGEAGPAAESPLLAEGNKRVKSWLRRLSEYMDGPFSDEERAVKRLLKWVEVDAEKKAHVITVVCHSGSPRLSQRIVEEVVAEFQRRHILAHQSHDSISFFERQRERLKVDLETASQQLRDEKNAVGVVSVDVQRDIIRSEINNINAAIAAASSSLAESQSKVARLQRQFPGATVGIDQVGLLPDEDQATGTTTAALDEMRSSLFTLQLRDRELASKYFEDHPLRKALRAQVEDAELILAEQELLLESTNIGKWEAHLKSLEQKMSEAKDKLLELNRSEVRVKKAQDEVDRVNRAYLQYEENLEVARIDQALQQQRITNVRVVQDPTLQNKPVSPQKMLLAILGAMGAGVMGLGVGVVSEYFDPTLKTNEEVESELDVPVLVSIPQMPRHRVRMN